MARVRDWYWHLVRLTAAMSSNHEMKNTKSMTMQNYNGSYDVVNIIIVTKVHVIHSTCM